MVYILLAEGFEEMEALIPADLLRRAGIETALASTDGALVTGGHGITVQADVVLSQINVAQMEMLVLPGGGEGVAQLSAVPAVAALVQEAVDRDIPLAAICAAPTLLGRWGHLVGKRCVCYPGLEGQLTGASVTTDTPVVQDGLLLTAQAAGSAFDFGLRLIAMLMGEARAQEVQRGIYYR